MEASKCTEPADVEPCKVSKKKSLPLPLHSAAPVHPADNINVDKLVCHGFFQLIAAALVAHDKTFPVVYLYSLISYLPMNIVCLLDSTENQRDVYLSHVGSLTSVLGYCILTSQESPFTLEDYVAFFNVAGCIYICLCLYLILKNCKDFFACIFIILQACVAYAIENDISFKSSELSPVTVIQTRFFFLFVFMMVATLMDDAIEIKMLRTCAFTSLSFLFFQTNMYESVFQSEYDYYMYERAYLEGYEDGFEYAEDGLEYADLFN